MILEHPSIGSALRLAGLSALDKLAGDALPLAIGWSSVSSMLLRPECAWLSLPYSEYVSLPASAASIAAAIESASTYSSDADFQKLLSPPAQLLWALRELLDEASSDAARADRRVVELLKFCKTHWPGWFALPLNAISAKLHSESPDEIKHAISRLIRISADAIDLYSVDGLCTDLAYMIDALLGVTRAAIGYYLSGHLDCTDLADLLNEREWWTALAQQLLEARSRLEHIAGPTAHHSRLQQRFESLRASVNAMIGSADEVMLLSSAELESKLRILDSLLHDVEVISRDCARVHAELASISSQPISELQAATGWLAATTAKTGVSRSLPGRVARKAFVTSMGPEQACLLSKASSSLLDVEYVPNPSQYDWASQDVNDILIIGDYGGTGSGHALAKALRTNRFVWNPIILLQFPTTCYPDDNEWAFYRQPFPADIQSLLDMIPGLAPLPQDRRTNILESALFALANDLWHIRRATSDRAVHNEDRVRQQLRETVAMLQRDEKLVGCPAVDTYSHLVQSLLELPGLNSDAVTALRQAIVRIEAVARESGASAILRTAIHRLSNQLRLPAITMESSNDALQRVVSTLTAFPLAEGAELIPEATAAVTEIRGGLIPLLTGITCSRDELAQAIESLRPCIEQIKRLSSTHAAEHPDVRGRCIERIVIVEDDPDWLALIEGIVASESPKNLPVLRVCNREDAERVLGDSVQETLALVDIGLPLDAKHASGGSPIELDAGLKLIRSFSGYGSGTRFIVLTAAQNFAEAVKMSLQAGVQPWDYIQKDPSCWEEQLRSRLRLALSADYEPEQGDLRVFRCTGRLVQLNGVEVLLGRKPYMLLEYLAENAGRWCSVSSIRSALTTPGRRDITPSMSKDDEQRLDRGERITPYNLLTPKHIQDHIYAVRTTIDTAFRATGRTQVPDLIAYDESSQCYRLQASAVIYDSFADLTRRHVLRRALVVEDLPDWQADIASSLAALGFEVRCAGCVDEVLSQTEDWIPDLVTLDLQLPASADDLRNGLADESNGVRVMELLLSAHPQVKIAVLTSIAWNDALMLRIIRNGILLHDYIDKKWDDALHRLENSAQRLMIEAERQAQIPSSELPDKIWSVSIPQKQHTVVIDSWEVKLSPAPYRVFGILAQSPYAPVDRDLIVDLLWDADELSETYEDSLYTIIRRLRSEITAGTTCEVDGQSVVHVDGKSVVRSSDGVYWLHGVVASADASNEEGSR